MAPVSTSSAIATRKCWPRMKAATTAMKELTAYGKQSGHLELAAGNAKARVRILIRNQVVIGVTTSPNGILPVIPCAAKSSM